MLLNANIAFLAIPNLSQNGVAYLAPAQICSCMSIFASVGSITVSLMLIRSNRSKAEMGAAEAVCSEMLTLFE